MIGTSRCPSTRRWASVRLGWSISTGTGSSSTGNRLLMDTKPCVPIIAGNSLLRSPSREKVECNGYSRPVSALQIPSIRHVGVGSPPLNGVEWRWEVAHGGADSEATVDDRGVRERLGVRGVPSGCAVGADPGGDL